MAEPADADDLDRRVQIMTTTHFTLATQRASTIAEANGRATLFLTSVSMSLVALGFIAQATELGPAFFLFAYVLLASLSFVGLVTFNRVVQTGVEDSWLARGEARVRRFYAETAPGIDRWFVLPTGEDRPDRMAAILGGSRLQILLTAGSMIGVVNSVVLGVLAGLAAARELSLGLTGGAGVGGGVFLSAAAAHLWRQWALWRRVETADTE